MIRVCNILFSTSMVEAKQLMRPLMSGGVVLALFLPLLLTCAFAPRGVSTSHTLQATFYFISLVGLVLLAGAVTYDFVGSRKSGFISLVALTGLTPGQWCQVCVGEIWRNFLLIWIVRLPILAWLHTQGNMDWKEVLALELIFFCLFNWLSSLALLFGSEKIAKGITIGIAWGGYIIWEVVCNLGVLLNGIYAYYGMPLTPWIGEITQLLSRFSVFRSVLSLFTGGLDPAYLTLQTTTLLGFAVFCLWRFSRVIFADIGANALGIEGETSSASSTKTKNAPRCWSNALAWQAFYFHHHGMKTVYGRSLGYVALLIVILVMNYFQFSLTEYGSFLFAGIGLITVPLFAANVALAKEIKEQTLPSLTLAVGDSVKLFKGWSQSYRRMMVPDLFFLPVIIAAIYWSSPVIAYGIFTGILGIACVAPLLFLSIFLSAWTWINVKTSAMIFLVMLAIAGIGGLIGWLINWYLFPIVVIPLLYVFGQRVLHKYLPKFFDPLHGTQKL